VVVPGISSHAPIIFERLSLAQRNSRSRREAKRKISRHPAIGGDGDDNVVVYMAERMLREKLSHLAADAA
jgi:hypothetical protein